MDALGQSFRDFLRGELPALAPALVLLFFGSSWQMIITGLGFNVVFSVAMGLGALLALERGDRIGDLLACGLLLVSVATLSIGLAFLVGVATSVLLGSDRRRRRSSSRSGAAAGRR